jgi:hypothetical protein
MIDPIFRRRSKFIDCDGRSVDIFIVVSSDYHAGNQREGSAASGCLAADATYDISNVIFREHHTFRWP